MTNRLAPMVVLLCWPASFAWGNLVANGDFSGGTHPQTFSNVTDILPDGWKLAAPNPDSLTNANVENSLTSFPGFPDPGGSSAYFGFQSHAQGTQGQDCLSQDINSTVHGQEYNLSFWLAITSASTYLFLDVNWDEGGSNSLFLYPTGFSAGPGNPNNADSQSGTSSSGPVAFEQFSITVMASQPITTIFFHAEDSNGAILLADVSLTPNDTPEPAPIWLVASGIGMVALGRWARKHSLLS